MSKSPSLTKEQKLNALIKLYISTFESYKKYMSKKDKNFQNIKVIQSQFKEPEKFLNIYKNKRICSLLIVEPAELPNIKIMEKDIDTLETIMQNDLIEHSILQEMSEKILLYIHKFFQNNEMELNISLKILNLCKKIYTNQYTFIHNEHLKMIIKIYLRIYLALKNNSNFHENSKKALLLIIDHILRNLEESNESSENKNFEKHLFDSSNNINISFDIENDKKKEILNKIQLNEFKFISSKYISYLIDLIEIQNHIKEENGKNIIFDYIKIIQSPNLSSFKSEIENLNLEQYKETLNNEFYFNKIGKYGWCICCRNTANFWSNKLNFPICNNNNNECELEILRIFNNINSRGDFLNMLIYLSVTSTVGASDQNNDSEVNSSCRHFCLKIIRKMLEKGAKYFINDNDVIYIIKQFVKDSLLQNTLSNDIYIFKSSLKLFLTIFKYYREHLKDQIEIFFNKILIQILESENIGFQHKNAILETLLLLADDCNFLVEIYVNYDCDINCSGIFQNLIDLLTRIMNGFYRKPKYQTVLKAPQENFLSNIVLEFLKKFIHNLNILVVNNEKKKKDIIEVDNFNDNDEQNNVSVIENKEYIGDIKDKIDRNLKIKQLLSKAIEIFNIGKSSSDCLKFLKRQNMVFNEEAFNKIKDNYIQNLDNNINTNNNNNAISVNSSISNGIIDKNVLNKNNTIISDISNEDLSVFDTSKITNIMQTPFISNINPLLYFLDNTEREKLNELKYENYIAFEMARFVRSNLKDLKRERVGDFLCKGDPLHVNIVKLFINSFNFKKLYILEALRLLFRELPLAGEAQVIDRIVQIFGEKYIKDNPSSLKNADIAYYISFSVIMLNTDLHREEVDKKMTCKEFVNQIYLSCSKEDISEQFIVDLYNRVYNNPLVIPGTKISGNKNKLDLIKQEKESIMRSTVNKLESISTITNNYIKNVDNDNIKHLIEYCWSNFLSIFSQLLADDDGDKIVDICIDNISTMAQTLGILRLDNFCEAYINTITNMTNMNEGREVGNKNIKSLKALISFITNSGMYIHAGWNNILTILSKIEYYQNTENNIIIDDIKRKSKMRNVEKEINLTLQNKEIVNKNISDMVCDNVFSKTSSFDEETIINFVKSLCDVSNDELNHYYKPREYSLRKLVEVAEFNISRIQVEWVKIWKLIGEHFISVISHSKHENIWRNSLDNLKQVICKLIQKQDLSVFNFQMDFFRPFAIIFSQTENEPNRGEMILFYLHYIVGTYSKNIHSGWIVIFNILKEGLKRKDNKINEDIKNTLQKVYDDFSIFHNNPNPDIFRGYIECLCYMYLEKNMKQYAFETILNLFSKIMEKLDSDNIKKEDDKNKNTIRQSKNNKKFEFLKIFFYGFDDLITVDVIEYSNLLFEIISHNREIIFSEDNYSFLYIYYCFFKPHLCILLFNYFENLIDIFEENEVKELYKNYSTEENINDKYQNIQIYIEKSLEEEINDLEKNNDKYQLIIGEDKEIKEENKKTLIKFIKGIKDNFDKENDVNLISRKIQILSTFDEKNLEMGLEFFLEKFKELIGKIEDQVLNYNYFFEDLLLMMHDLSLFNKQSSLILRILATNLISLGNKISQKTIEKISSKNLFILNILSNISLKIDEKKLKEIISFGSSYTSFLSALIQNTSHNLSDIYKKVSKIFAKILQIFFDGNFGKEFLTSNDIIDMLIALERIQKSILDNYDKLEELFDSSSIISLDYLAKIFVKYQINKEENAQIINVIKNKIDNIIPKLLKFLNEKELESVFNNLMDFMESSNLSLRTSSKNLLKVFINLKLCVFNKYSEEKI